MPSSKRFDGDVGYACDVFLHCQPGTELQISRRFIFPSMTDIQPLNCLATQSSDAFIIESGTNNLELLYSTTHRGSLARMASIPGLVGRISMWAKCKNTHVYFFLGVR